MTARAWWDAGYDEIVSVVPFRAPVNPASRIAKGVGKAPGELYANGLWDGTIGWQKKVMAEADVAKMDRDKASVGLRTGKAFVLDLDTYDDKQAAELEAKVTGVLGEAPMRVGQWPKRALLYRCDGHVKQQKVVFAGRHGEINIVEINAQTVVEGVHPKTEQPYEWPRKPRPFDQLTFVTGAQVDALMEELRRSLPKATRTVSGGADTAPVSQKKLGTDNFELVAEIMRSLPNSRALFPHWSDMIRVGYALRAALPNHEALALELWHEWCSRWEGGDYDEDATERRWHSLKGPYRVGIEALCNWADQILGRPDNRQPYYARLYYGEPATSEPLTDDDGAPVEAPPDFLEIAVIAETAQAIGRFKFLTFDEASDAALGEKSTPLIKGLLEAGAMSVMYGDSNTGKTFVAMDMAFHIGAGLPYAGMKVSRGVVVYIAAEGGRGAKKRLMALRNKFGAKAAGVQFFLLATSVNLRDPAADLKPLIAALEALGVEVAFLVIDTMSRALAGGDENSSVDVGSLVKNFDALRASTGAHLMVVHHSGKDRARGARGWSGLRAATDTEIEIADRVISVEKQRDLDKEWTSGFELEVQTLGLDGDGDPITSCTVRLVSATLVKTGIATATELDVQDAVEIIARTDPAAARGVTTKMLEAFFADNKSPMTSEGLRYHLRQMEGKGLIERAGRGVWRCNTEDITSSALVRRHFVPTRTEESGGETEGGIFD